MKCSHCGGETKNWIKEDDINIPKCRGGCYKPIPGSSFFRTFCSECRQPMIVTDNISKISPKCDDCGNLKKIAANGSNLTKRQKIGSGKTK
jgi:hypothetical protein